MFLISFFTAIITISTYRYHISIVSKTHIMHNLKKNIFEINIFVNFDILTQKRNIYIYIVCNKYCFRRLESYCNFECYYLFY